MWGGGGEVVYSTLAISLCECGGRLCTVYCISYEPVCGGGKVVYSILAMSVCVWGGGGRLCTVHYL